MIPDLKLPIMLFKEAIVALRNAEHSKAYTSHEMKLTIWGLALTASWLQVLVIDSELNAIVVKGAIPGKEGNLVEITPAKIVGKNC